MIMIMQAVRQRGQLFCELNVAVFGCVLLPNANPLLLRVEEKWGRGAGRFEFYNETMNDL